MKKKTFFLAAIAMAVLIIISILIYNTYIPKRFRGVADEIDEIAVSIQVDKGSYEEFFIVDENSISQLYLLLEIPIKRKVWTTLESGVYNQDSLIGMEFKFTNGKNQRINYSYGDAIYFYISDPQEHTQLLLHSEQNSVIAMGIKEYISSFSRSN